MIKNEIIDSEDFGNEDLKDYIIDGRLFQYDLSSRTSYVDDIVSTAKYNNYDLVIIPDDLNSDIDNSAYIIINPNILIPLE